MLTATDIDIEQRQLSLSPIISAYEILVFGAESLGRSDMSVIPHRRLRILAASRDSGFSLIEIMVVIVVMGVLMAISIPKYPTGRRCIRSTPRRRKFISI